MEKVKKKSHEIDMTTGNLFGKIILFALPLAATAILQLLFNSADMIIVGQFDSEDAMGAVGATSSLSHLIVAIVLGFSVGAGVVLANAFGAKNAKYGDKVLHTAMLLSVVSGIIVGAIGFFLVPSLLRLMGTLPKHYEMAKTYLQIIMVGAPFNMVYNFGASMLRATGDTKRSLIFLTIAGVINVIVNIILVAGIRMGVAGVAIATILSQAVSAVLVVITLFKSTGFVKLSFKRMKFDKRAFGEIMKLGVPTGIQSALLSISNVLLQSAINSFGNESLNNGSAIAVQVEGYVYAIINSISSTSLTVIGQNYGARDYKRIKKTIFQCTFLVVGVSLVIGWACVLCHKPLCHIFMNSSGDVATQNEIIGFALQRMTILCGTYFLDGIMEVVTFGMRGVGNSFTSMLIVLVGTCFLRIFWIYCIFPFNRTLMFLLLLYPLSWTITAAVGAVAFVIVLKKCVKRDQMYAATAKNQQLSA